MSLSSEDDAAADGVGPAEVADPNAVPPAPEYPPAELDLALRTPVTDASSGSLYESLRLVEPTDQQWSTIYDQPLETRRRFAISHIAKVPMGVIAQMKISDVVRAETYIWGFFLAAQADRPW